MKKTLLIVTAALSISLLGCKKETSLTTEKSIDSDKQTLVRGNPGTYDHVIYNLKYKGFKGAFLSSRGHYEGANVYMKYAQTTSDRWYMERIGKYVKFLYQERYFWEKWRALGINWNYEASDGSMNAVIYELNSNLNQQWELIGYGDPKSTNHRKGFEGVIVNRYNGKMLEANTDKDGNVNVFARENYYGSKYEKEFKEDGCFCSTDKRLLWDVHIIPRGL